MPCPAFRTSIRNRDAIRGFHVGDAQLGGVRTFDTRVKIQHDAQWSVLTRASIFYPYWRAGLWCGLVHRWVVIEWGWDLDQADRNPHSPTCPGFGSWMLDRIQQVEKTCG